MPSSHSGSPVSENSRPSSITRSSRESFVSELETLPPECDYLNELNEEVLDIEDVSEDESDHSVRSRVCKDTDEGNGKVVIAVQEDGEETEVEAKIRKGLEKIKKLDKILLEKTEYEKEVKQERRDLERKFQSQVSKLIEEKGADKVCGSQQLLYLCASADRSEASLEIDELVEPIFPTQIDIEYYKECSSNSPSCNSEPKETVSESGSNTENKQKKGKNFVKRNIQLAAHAQDTILLTDEEKKRLDELLADDSDLLMVENPFSNNISTLTGFQFSQEEHVALQNIDAQLKELIPSEEFLLAVGDSHSVNLEESLSTDSKLSLSVDGDNNSDMYMRDAKCGEKVLQQGGEQRRDECRMRDIDARLKQLQFIEDDEKLGSPRLDPDMLRKLLDVNSRLTSDSVSICESLHSKSSVYDIDDVTGGEELFTA